MSLYFEKYSNDDGLNSEDLKRGLFEALDKLGAKKKVLAIPPDFTRYHSFAGELTQLTWQYYNERLTDVLPALGTHFAMTKDQIDQMFGNVPQDLFRIHNWRTDVATLGQVPADFVNKVSENKVNYRLAGSGK